ncbi:arylsulfatase [Carboxylicivirga sediminis]|uniref:Arylsulfatase n=1 Tax=Carboxylicivirga sediminis TaxID=2006564 RepID=A0A941IVI7_9BACT|nr:arylsulfatase [Carboxylicivirga sediminis]MBR8535156.1 arylsulfatase [Carboxylicivirga sediminis]
MRTITLLALVALFTISLNGCLTTNTKQTKEANKPNIIYILADDLGYGELGCYGQKQIETPHIDALAASGMLFKQHYSGAPVCAPSRCVLMTGKHMGHSYVRGNDEWKERGDVWNYKAQIADSTLEGQRPLPKETQTIGRLLQSNGYKTAVVGKWGLGAPHTDGIPTKQGFDYFFGYNCQRQAHTYYPVHLYENENRFYLNNDTVAPGTKLADGADPYDIDNYKPYNLNEYSPDLMFGRITNFIEHSKDEPFFLYWATPIPHAPIQAPQHWVDYYTQKFGDEEPYDGNRGYFPHRYPHAGYAAMVSYLDERVGQLIAQLKELGQYENTIIIFSSDNGPTYNGGTDSPWFNSGGPFNSKYGSGKGFLHEGGIRVPMIASWPGHIKAGSESEHISAFWDVLPTLCDIGGVEKPEDTDGISFLPELMGEQQEVHQYLYWEYPEYGGQLAVRLGNFKAICKNVRKENNTQFELYNLELDPQEQNNIAASHPEILVQVGQILNDEHIESWNNRWKFMQLGDSITNE